MSFKVTAHDHEQQPMADLLAAFLNMPLCHFCGLPCDRAAHPFQDRKALVYGCDKCFAYTKPAKRLKESQ